MSNEPDYSQCTDEELLTFLRRAKVKGVSDKWKRPALEKNCTKHGLTKVKPETQVSPEKHRDELEQAFKDAEERSKEKVFSHPSRVRCENKVPSRNHPAFLGVKEKCGGAMQPERLVTNTSGRRKRYKCPDCGERKDVSGEEI